jgi:hypothetical protein
LQRLHGIPVWEGRQVPSPRNHPSEVAIQTSAKLPEPEVTPEERDAWEAFHEKRNELRYSSPCQEQPEVWDSLHDGESKRDCTNRVLLARRGCDGCLLRRECWNLLLAEKAEGNKPRGVFAGWLVDDAFNSATDVNMYVDARLEKERRAQR